MSVYFHGEFVELGVFFLCLQQEPFQVLVLAPTRELATQINRVVRCLGDFMGARCAYVLFIEVQYISTVKR